MNDNRAARQGDALMHASVFAEITSRLGWRAG